MTVATDGDVGTEPTHIKKKVYKKSESRKRLQKATHICPCACDGVKCHRPNHLAGSPCDRMINLSATNRHRVCNSCRKMKPVDKTSKKEVSSSITSLTLPPVIPDNLPPGPVPPLQNYGLI